MRFSGRERSLLRRAKRCKERVESSWRAHGGCLCGKHCAAHLVRRLPASPSRSVPRNENLENFRELWRLLIVALTRIGKVALPAIRQLVELPVECHCQWHWQLVELEWPGTSGSSVQVWGANTSGSAGTVGPGEQLEAVFGIQSCGLTRGLRGDRQRSCASHPNLQPVSY